MSKVALKIYFVKILVRGMAGSMSGTVLRKSLNSFRWRNILGFCIKTLLKVLGCSVEE